ncbi:UNVERIFIED_CONTAM: hypothetical protein GTU68_000874 [Idotea baltica]|nr:hypothetical protein [Idotea baltica]
MARRIPIVIPSTVFLSVLILSHCCRDTEPGGLDSLFLNIGLSPSCVSQALSKCESFKISSSLLGIQNQVESIQKSIEKQQIRNRPRNCADLLKQGDQESGVRTVYPFSCCENKPVSVFCDQTTDGGGWTVIQRRKDLSQRENFYRNWIEYQIGFGNVTREFWLGLENIHVLGKKRWAKYNYFYIGNSANKYRLDVGEFSGDAGDSLSYHSGQQFSTKDQDNDASDKSCSELYKGAWWYKKCHLSNLNGYQHDGLHESFADGINWKTFQYYNYSLKETTMSIRPAVLNFGN